MKKRIVLLMLMGVLALASCTSYRIKVVSHPNGTTYYFPEKRFLVSEWEGVRTYNGSYTLEWARNIIKEDKRPDKVKITYIK
jgi:hypothetical protein